jgi:ArsR family transcriptional regulator
MSKYRTSSKKQNQEIMTQKIATFLKALSHPHRLKIFLNLVQTCKSTSCKTSADISQCIGQAGANLNIAPSTHSHHIKELKQAELLIVKRSGQKNQCFINPESLHELRSFFNGLPT